MSGGDPLANLRSIHEGRGDFAIRNVPDILLADSSGYDELKGAKLILAQRLQSVIKGVLKTIVEGDAYNPSAAGAVTTGTGQAAFQKLLASEMDRLKVDYNLIVSVHAPAGGDRDVTKADLMKGIGKASGN